MFAKNSDHQRLSDQDLHAFVDGELDGGRYRHVVQQLATDAGAAERLNAFLRQHGELALLREHLGGVEADEADRRTVELSARLADTIRHHRRVRRCSAAASVMVAALVGSWTVWGPDPTSLMPDHLSFASIRGPQMLFGRDPFGGAQLVAGGLDVGTMVDEQLAAYAVRRPDFAAHGLAFVGGNALQGGKSPAVRLVYRDEEERLVYLFVGTVGGEADVALTLVPEGHVSLNWRRGALVFALIGPKESEQLLDLMRSTGEFQAPVPALRPDQPTATTADATPVLAPSGDSGVTPAVGGLPEASGVPADSTLPMQVAPTVAGDNPPKSL